MPPAAKGPPRGGPFSSHPPPSPAARPAARHATRAVFVMLGIGFATWAPLVPDAKARLALADDVLGTLLLALGLGALAALPAAGLLVPRLGPRRAMLAGGVLFCALLPALALAPSPAMLALLLALFGAATALVDIAMNVQGVLVERASGRILMSGFHGAYSAGGLLGAGTMALLLAAGLAPAWCAAAMGLLGTALLLGAAPALLGTAPDAETPRLALPRGRLALIGALCCIAFLLEGAVLDWSGVFIRFTLGADPAQAGLGFAALAAAMTLGRLAGDHLVARLRPIPLLRIGAGLAAVGFALAALAPTLAAFLAGCALVGLGVANMVPVLFSAAGRQPNIAPSHAIAAAATPGYAGLLAGPVAVGWIAEVASLPATFLLLGALAVPVGLWARAAMR